MIFKQFQKRLSIVKDDYNTIDKKNDELLKGLSAYVDDACGVGQKWMYDIVDNELKNLIYAADEKLTYKDEQKIDDLIEYYMYEMSFGGQISWEDDGTFGDGRKIEFDLSKDEDFYKYIFYLEDDNSKVVDLELEEKK